jgi:hypothetical protein
VTSALIELSLHGVPDRAGLSQAAFRWGVPAGSAILVLALAIAAATAIWRARRPPSATED